MGIIAISVPLGQTTLMSEGSWLMRGENILAISTTPHKTLPAKDARVKVTGSQMRNAKLDLAHERRA